MKKFTYGSIKFEIFIFLETLVAVVIGKKIQILNFELFNIGMVTSLGKG